MKNKEGKKKLNIYQTWTLIASNTTHHNISKHVHLHKMSNIGSGKLNSDIENLSFFELANSKLWNFSNFELPHSKSWDFPDFE